MERRRCSTHSKRIPSMLFKWIRNLERGLRIHRAWLYTEDTDCLLRAPRGGYLWLFSTSVLLNARVFLMIKEVSKISLFLLWNLSSSSSIYKLLTVKEPVLLGVHMISSSELAEGWIFRIFLTVDWSNNELNSSQFKFFAYGMIRSLTRRLQFICALFIEAAMNWGFPGIQESVHTLVFLPFPISLR